MKSTLILTCLTAGLLPLSGAELKSPEAPFIIQVKDSVSNANEIFSATGITKGQKSLIWQNNCFENIRFINNGQMIFGLQQYGSPSVPSWAPFTKFQTTANLETKTVQRTLVFQNTPQSGGTYTQTLQLLKSGTITLKSVFEFDKKNGKFQSFTTRLFFPGYAIMGKTVEINGKRITLPSKEEWCKNKKGEIPKNIWIHSGWYPNVQKIVFNPGEGEEEYTIGLNSVQLVIFRAEEGAFFYFEKKMGETVDFSFELGKSSENKKTDNVIEGVNFTNTNAFEVTVFDSARNWFINPSFESKSHYFYQNGKDLLQQLSTDARSGKFAMSPPFTSLNFPIRANQDYVLSFYAKSSNGKPANFNITAGSYSIDKKFYPKITQPGWQRFECVFNLPRTTVNFHFGGKNGVLFDDIQIEPGKKASPYAGNILGIELLTDSPEGNLVNDGKKINARFLVRGPIGTKGIIDSIAKDFFGRVIATKKMSFLIPSSGEQTIPYLEDKLFPKGVNTIRLTVKADGQKEYVDFFRITKMKYADATAKHRILHGNTRYGNFWNTFLNAPERELNILKYSGVGSFSYLGEHWEKETYDKLNSLGMISYGNYIPHSNNKFFDHFRWMIAGKELLIDGVPLKKSPAYPESFLKEVEDLTYKQAKMFPHVTYWTSATEPGAAFQTLSDGNIKDYAKLCLTINRALLRANPNIRYNPFGAWNMFDQGRREVLNFLRVCNELEPDNRFKAIDIHVYRAFPEMPDTDADFTEFKKGLAELGYPNIPVNWGEGAYFYPLIMPQWNIAPWASVHDKDRYYTQRIPSYDLGWGEKIGAAMTMRHNLIVYKNADRLINSCPWSPDLLDNEHPYAKMVTISVITDILGNADFKKEIRFAPGARAYVFEDEKNRPVAALWQFAEELDRGLRNHDDMTLDMKDLRNFEFIDMMGNRCSTRQTGSLHTIPLSSYPIFIRATKGSFEALGNALNTSIVNNGKPPIEFAAKISSRNTIELKAINSLSRNINAEIAVNNAPMQKINLTSQASRIFRMDLPETIPFDSISDISIPITMRHHGKLTKSAFDLNILPIKYMDKIQWKNIPSVPIKYIHLESVAKHDGLKYNGRTDLSASFQAAWNEKGLYLRIEAKDDTFVIHPKKKISHRYNDDSVQIFIDTLGDGRENARRNAFGLDQNDYCYELIPMSKSTAVVFRREVPDIQLTGGAGEGLLGNVVEKNVSCDFSYHEGKRIYEVFFPARFLMPLKFKAGAVPGIGLRVYDRDNEPKNDAKQVATNIKSGASHSPHLYTQLLFVE